MKLWKYHSVRIAYGSLILVSILTVAISYGYSWFAVEDKESLVQIIVIFLLGSILQGGLVAFSLRSKAIASYYLKRIWNQKIDEGIAEEEFEKFMEKESGEHVSFYVNDIPRVVELT